MIEALLGFAGVFVLALLRVPLAFATGLVGFIGLGLMRDWNVTAAAAGQVELQGLPVTARTDRTYGGTGIAILRIGESA